MPWTYILECADGSLYVGSTWDLERRVSEHELGLGAAYTRRRRPVRLVWSVAFPRVEDAYRFEKRVQSWSRAKRIALIEGRYDDLSELGSRGHSGRAARAAAQDADRLRRREKGRGVDGPPVS